MEFSVYFSFFIFIFLYLKWTPKEKIKAYDKKKIQEFVLF